MKITKTLRCLTVASLVVACALAQDNSGRHGYTSTSMTGESQEWRFVRWSDGILLENVMVNGKGPFRFLLDTGAEGAGRVDRALVAKLGLESLGGASTVGILGEEREMSEHHLDSLAIGGLSFKGVRVLSRDYNKERPRGLRPIDGILGFHLFRDYLLTVHYAARTVSVARGELPPADGKNILAIVSDDEDPEVEIRFGDKVTTALLDTGAMNTLALPASFAEGLEWAGEPKAGGGGGQGSMRRGTLRGVLHIGAAEFADPMTIVAERLPQANVGVRLFASLVVTFDQKNARVRVQSVPERKRYGVELGTSPDGAHSLRAVAEGSIAAAAGLRSSDTILSINGKAVAEIDREGLLRQLDEPSVTLVVERAGKREELRMTLD